MVAEKLNGFIRSLLGSNRGREREKKRKRKISLSFFWWLTRNLPYLFDTFISRDFISILESSQSGSDVDLSILLARGNVPPVPPAARTTSYLPQTPQITSLSPTDIRPAAQTVDNKTAQPIDCPYYCITVPWRPVNDTLDNKAWSALSTPVESPSSIPHAVPVAALDASAAAQK